MVRKAILPETSVITKKYWTQAATAGAAVPKLFALVGDEETIKSLLYTFDKLYLDTPDSGSVFAIDYYKYKGSWYNDVYVDVSYCPDGSNLSGSCTLLTGRSARSFESLVNRRNEQYERALNLLNPTVEAVCSIPAPFLTTQSYQSTSRAYTDLLKNNGFQEEVMHRHGWQWHSHTGGSSYHRHCYPGQWWCK